MSLDSLGLHPPVVVDHCHGENVISSMEGARRISLLCAPLESRSRYSDEYIAKVKALLCLMTIKGVCHITGLPPLVVRDWKSGKRRADVEPDKAVFEAIRGIVLP